MGIINDMLFSYDNSKGKTVKGIRFSTGTNDRFPFEVYSQGAIRLHAFLARYQGNATQVLDAFLAGKPVQATRDFTYDEYQGHKLIVLAAKDGDKNVLKIGLGKAAKVAAAVKAHGVDAIMATLAVVVGDAKAMDSKPPRKGGKGKGKGQGGQPAVDIDVEEAEIEAMSGGDGVDSHPELDAPSDFESRIAQNERLIVALFDEITRLQAETRALKAGSLVVA